MEADLAATTGTSCYCTTVAGEALAGVRSLVLLIGMITLNFLSLVGWRDDLRFWVVSAVLLNVKLPASRL